MKNTIKIVLLTLIPMISFGQAFQIEFQKYWETKDTISQKELLLKWEAVNPDDPELWTSYFNYHFMKARQEVLVLTNGNQHGEGVEVTDSSTHVQGFLGSQTYFDPVEIQKAIAKIDEGIRKFPDRLDMRFGKIYLLGEIEDWKKFEKEIIKTVDYSASNQNKWTWTNNEKQDCGKDFFLSTIQGYQTQLYNTYVDSLLLNIQRISHAVLKYYPEHIESLTSLSITYLLLGEYDKGLAQLLKAEKVNPRDCIVLSNIAHGYMLKGDKNKAIEYYEKLIQFGDEQVKAFAKQQIEVAKT